MLHAEGVPGAVARIAKPLRRVKLGTQGGARESNLLSVPVRMMPECCGPADFASQALAVHYAPKNGLCNDGGNHCVHGCAVVVSLSFRYVSTPFETVGIG